MKFRHVLLIFISLAVCLTSCSSKLTPILPEDSLVPGWHEGSLQHEGLERVFLFFVPENLPENAAVVILLHGGTRSMEELFYNNAGGSKEWPTVAEEEGFLLLVPNGTHIFTGAPTGTNQQWNDCREIGSEADDVGFIVKLIDWVDNKISMDAQRVYASGISNGGLMAYRLARELDDKIAAIAVFIANKPQNDHCNNLPQSVVPIMIVNGTEDPIMPYQGGEVSNGGRGFVLSTQATIAYWNTQYGITPEPVAIDTLQNLQVNDESRVIRMRYGSSQLGATVVLYKVVGGGHLVPSAQYVVPHWIEQLLGNQNNDVEGARIAWKFLSHHVK